MIIAVVTSPAEPAMMEPATVGLLIAAASIQTTALEYPATFSRFAHVSFETFIGEMAPG